MTMVTGTIPGTQCPSEVIGTILCPRKVIRAWPDAYALQTEGDCLAPEIGDGDHVVASPSAPLRCGDYAVLHGKEGGCSVKRLVIVPDPDLWNSGSEPGSNISGVLVIEMTNPRKTFFVSCDKLDAVHAVVYVHKEGARPDAERLAGRVS